MPSGSPCTTETNGNKFMSPFSFMAALMLRVLETGGNTERQVMSALNLNGIRGNDYLNTSLTNDDIIVSINNRLFPKLGFAFRQRYMIDAKRYCGSKMLVNPSGLMIDKVIDKAFVSVGEEGTEAAAVTVVGVVRT
ncbi:hypothetical protein KUTeg_002038 [Tegillarca granosa]|uniref:Serpin domain-containing protein n=1 Tax=Tegillarca granosa TaxID=220873 RepID=A0ABQ9FT76_TEGGR|nr:hypothetical protein KUTeg_002038 [Tegillarca granosa]